MSRATDAQMRHALAEAAQVGPFFRLEVVDDRAAAGWLPLAGAVADLVASTAAQLGTGEVRVAASILHQGVAARVWSPVLGCGVLGGTVPDLGSLVVTAQPPIRLGITSPAGWAVSGTEQLAAVSLNVVSAQLVAVSAALPGRLAAGLLRGNSASAMVGALTVLTRSRPGRAPAAIALGQALLRSPALAGTGVLAEHGLEFRRRSCCLYYRVPGGGLCGDCCFSAVHSAPTETPGQVRD